MSSQPIYNESVSTKTEEFVSKAKSVHGDKFDYSKCIYVNHNTKVTLICPHHGEFEQLPYVHKRGSDCPSCSKETMKANRIANRKATLEKEFREVHGDRFDYTKALKEFVDVDTPVTITCPEHGDFKTTPTRHLKGTKGCNECYRRTISSQRSKDFSHFKTKMIYTHGNRYEYDESTFTDSNNKIRIICPKHGEFFQSIQNHINSRGCPFCAKENHGKSRVLTTERFIEKSAKAHEGYYSYGNSVYTGNRDKIIVTCPIHGDFKTNAANHMFGDGRCPSCGTSPFAGRILKNGDTGRKGHIYVIKLSNENETFIKVGISTEIHKRLRFMERESGYKIEKIYTRKGSIYDSAYLEMEIHRNQHLIKYQPDIEFGGKTECYDIDSQQTILETLNELTEKSILS